MASNRVIDADNDIIIKGLQWPSSDGTANQVIQTNGSGTLTFTDQTGGGSTGINHITNPQAEVDTTGYVSYADAAATTPVDGTGGSANVTIARNTSSPLRNAADFKIEKDAANRQGQGISNDFTIDAADKSKKILISFDYDASHAGYADGDIKIYIYDVTNTQLIRVANEDLKAGKGKHFSQFQSNSDSTSYRLIWHVASTNASAYNVFMDEVFVGPIHISNPVSSNDIVCVVEGLTSAITLSNGVGVTITGWNDPTVDTTNSFDGTNDYYVVPETGHYDIEFGVHVHDEASPHEIDAVYQEILVDGVVKRTGGFQTASGNASSINSTHMIGQLLTKGQQVSFKVSYSGGDATNLLNNDGTITYFSISKRPSLMTPETVGNGQDVICVVQGISGTQTLSNGVMTKITGWNDPTTDTTGSFNGTTDEFTVPQSGYYDINFGAQISGEVAPFEISAVYAGIFIDGTEVRSGGHQSRSGLGESILNVGADGYYLSKGQVLHFSIRYDNGDATNTLLTNSKTVYFDIAKRSSGQAILENETVAARYTLATSDAIGTSDTDIDFDTKDYDTHAAYSGGVFTTPTTGYYKINAKVHGQAEAYSAGGYLDVTIKVDTGSGYASYERSVESTAAGTLSLQAKLDSQIYLNKGDLVKVTSKSTVATNVEASADLNSIAISRIK